MPESLLTPPLTVLALLHAKHGLHQGPSGEQGFWYHRGEEYVRKLVRGVSTYLPDAHFRLMTDVPTWFPDLDTVPLSGVGAAWWAKLDMFRPEVSSGLCLYLDLDNVICGPLDELVALGRVEHPERPPIWGMDDVFCPRQFNASTMLFHAEHPDCRRLFTRYAENPRYYESKHAHEGAAYDQEFITETLGYTPPFMQDYLPEGYVLNSRVHLERGADWSNCRLLVGGWQPKPHESDHPYYKQHWGAL